MTILFLGVILLIVGIGYGVTSKQVTLLKFAQGSIAHYLSNSTSTTAGDHLGYLQMAGSADFFIVHEQDFTPAIHGIDTFQDGLIISFTYDPSDTTDIDVQSTLSTGTVLKGSASAVVEITAYGDGSQTEYTTSLYRNSPHTYYKNNWPVGLGIGAGGLLVLLLSFFLISRSKRVLPASGMGVPRGPEQPYQSPEQPVQYAPQPGYNPPPQNPSQPGYYPPAQPTQYTAYPPQQGQYDQTQRAPDPYNNY